LASHETAHILWNPKIHYHIRNSLPHDPILSQIHPVHALPDYSLKIRFNIILPSTPTSSKQSLSSFPHQNSVCISPFPHKCHMPYPGHSSWSEKWHNFWRGIQTRMFLVRKFPKVWSGCNSKFKVSL